MTEQLSQFDSNPTLGHSQCIKQAGSNAGADQSFVACSEVAGGEDCEAILRFGNYWIALMAEMLSQSTPMGHSRFGLTHPEFEQLVEKVASQARSVLQHIK